ncbi:MAG: alkaline phosphatase [Bryobacteraceae bacterium]|nr:alkaline phosphatase [Bryobacteraceae bacterium]
MRRHAHFLFAALLLAAQLAPAQKPRRARNVILLLADAGGVATVNAASIVGYNAPLKLFVQSWENVGLSDTSTASKWVSDSAAGMTAIVTGRKTHNGVISQGPDAVRGKQDGAPLKTILEYAEERGLATGVLSNVMIADATPAACYGHANDRAKHGELFLQLFSPRFGDGVDILFGPGRKYLYDAVGKTGRSLDAAAGAANRTVHASLSDVAADAKRAIAVLDGQIDLNDAAKRAIRALSSNPKGFFLMIESDAHTDNPEAGLARLVAFDKLIREIASMVNLNETLLLFTADHSFDLRVVSGGPDEPLLKGFAGQKDRSIRLPFVRMDNSHTGEEVLVAARGAGAERVRGFVPNTRLFEIMMAAYGWKQR